MSTLINKLMMGADAWARLANTDVSPGLRPEYARALYEERMVRAAEYRLHADRIRVGLTEEPNGILAWAAEDIAPTPEPIPGTQPETKGEP
jgi:hypothetical protein